MALPHKSGTTVRTITLRNCNGNSNKGYAITICVAESGLASVFTAYGPWGKLSQGQCVARDIFLAQAERKADAIASKKQNQGDAYTLVSDVRTEAAQVPHYPQPSVPIGKPPRTPIALTDGSSRAILNNLF